MDRLEHRREPANLLNGPTGRLQRIFQRARASVDRLTEPGMVLAWLPLLGALAIWVGCLQRIDPGAMNDLGLASVLPYAAWLPHLLLSAGFFFAISRQPRRDWLTGLYLIALVLVLHGTPAIDYGTLRYPWAWKHLGIVDYIQRHGAVDPTAPFLSVYHNWPGFFAAAAFIVDLAGVRNLAASAKWMPLALNLLYLAALPMLFRSLTRDHRVISGGAWIFLTGNWVGQDYFSPQGVAFLFYLVLLGLCLRFLPPQRVWGAEWGWRMPRAVAQVAQWLGRGIPVSPALPSGASRVIVTATALLLILATTVSHQLTPLVAVSALGALAVLQRLASGLFLFAAVLVALWILYAAAPFAAMVLPIEIEGFGFAISKATDDLADISVVSPGQAVVSLICRLLTFAISIAALAGCIRRVMSGYRDGPAAALVLAPLPLLAATTYGGEIIFRVYLFALPFLAFFAAALFFPSPRKGRSAIAAGGAGLFGLVLAVAFVFANNGKDRQYAFTPEDVAAVQWLYETAPEETLLVEGASLYPSQFRNYEHFTHLSLADEPDESQAKLLADPASVLAQWLDNDDYRAAFIILTRSQGAYVDALRVMPPGAIDRIEHALLASPRFRLLRATGGTKIFALNQAVRGMGEWID